MTQRPSANPFDRMPDERLTFSDLTMLAFLAVSTSALAVLLLIGAVSAEHRIAAVLVRALAQS